MMKRSINTPIATLDYNKEQAKQILINNDKILNKITGTDRLLGLIHLYGDIVANPDFNGRATESVSYKDLYMAYINQHTEILSTSYFTPTCDEAKGLNNEVLRVPRGIDLVYRTYKYVEKYNIMIMREFLVNPNMVRFI